MAQILIASSLSSSNKISASYGYDTLTAVQQSAGYIQNKSSQKDNGAYGYYALDVAGFTPPTPGDGTFRAYLQSHTATQSTPCGNLSATAHPQVYLYVKGTLRVTLTSTSTSTNWYTGTVTSAVLATVTSASDFEVRAFPRYKNASCTDWSAEPTPKRYDVFAYGKIYYYWEIPSGTGWKWAVFY